MPSPDLNNLFQQYSLSEAELVNAKVLNTNTLALLQTIRAQKATLKVNSSLPEEANLRDSYFLKQAHLQGQVDMITELITNHTEGLKELHNIQTADPNTSSQQSEITDIATRASKLVHQNIQE